MAEQQKITFKTVTINKDNFLRVINPDTQVLETDGHIAYHTGIYGNKTDDGFFELAIDLFTNGAGAHQNLVNLKGNLILGNNLQAENDEDQAIVDKWISRRNKAGDNLKQVYEKASKDTALFNGCVLQVVFSRDGRIAEVYHVPMQNFRLGKPNKYGQIEYGYLSTTWATISNSKSSKNTKDRVKIRMFDPSVYDKHPVQLMYCKPYSYGFYSVPQWTSAINWILVSREISDFHLNNIRSNFFLSGMLTQKKGGMSDEQVEQNAQAIEQFYKGGATGRKVLLSYVEDLINDKPVFEKFSGEDQDEMFDLLSQQAFQQIVTAHQSYSILAGVDSKGSDLGGDSNKLVTTLAAFNYLVCEPMKEVIISNLNRIQELNEMPALMCITEPPKIAIPQGQPEDTTVNERRAMLYGLPEIDDSVNDVAPTNEIPTA